LSDPDVIERYRVAERDWTRTRKLSFAKVATLLLCGHKFPLQNQLNKAAKALGEVASVPTASAYCQARRKLQPELFVYLNELVTTRYAQLSVEDESWRTWHGRRVLGLDGTYVNVPDTEETRRQFSLQTNQHESGSRVQALGSVLYDVLNDVGVAAGLSQKRGEREFIFEQYLAVTRAGDVVVMDRNYADSLVMAFWLKNGRDFVIRLPRGGFHKVREFWISPDVERVVELRVPRKQERRARQLRLAETVRVRLVKVELADGEVEVLGTSLLDAEEWPRAELKQVYGWRWGVETYFDRIKNIFEVERFSGESVQSLKQDFYGVIFLATLETVLTEEVEMELQQESAARECQLVPQVNHSVSYAALVDYLIDLLMNQEQSVEATLAELQCLFRTNPTRHQAGRKFPRKKRSHARESWFHRYGKRTIA
jgi:hypothetical protein